MKSLVKLIVFSVILSMALAVLSGCNLFKGEKQKFVDATIEATCYIFQQDNIMDPTVEQAAKDIYKKYGFNTDDDAAMTALSEKYAQDTTVTEDIMAGIQKCNPGLFNGTAPAVTDTGTEVAPTDGASTGSGLELAPGTDTPAETPAQ